jgi:uncharacterized protein YbjT (DUF2867 family)
MNTTLVVGGTGAMGSRVALRLANTVKSKALIFTRDPGSAYAQSLVSQGGGRIQLIKGDVSDTDSIKTAMSKVDSVFCNTDFATTDSALGEYRHGISILEAARSKGVEKFIWSSLDSAVTLTNGRIPVPHYDSKAAVAGYINLHRSEEMMQKESDGWFTNHVSILVTAPYFENLMSRLVPNRGDLGDGREGLTFALPLGNGKYPLISLEDIAWYTTYMFEQWQSWGARDLAVMADSLTGDDIAAQFQNVTGTPSRYASVPLDIVRQMIPKIGHDLAAMMEFFQDRDLFTCDRDISLLRRLHPGLMTFKEWLRFTQWDGNQRDIQQYPVRLFDK